MAGDPPIVDRSRSRRARRSGKVAYGLPPNQPASRRVIYQCSGDPYEHQSVIPFRTQMAIAPVWMSFLVLLAAAGQSRRKPDLPAPLASMGGLQVILLKSVSLCPLCLALSTVSPAPPWLSRPCQTTVHTFQSASRSSFSRFRPKRTPCRGRRVLPDRPYLSPAPTARLAPLSPDRTIPARVRAYLRPALRPALRIMAADHRPRRPQVPTLRRPALRLRPRPLPGLP